MLLTSSKVFHFLSREVRVNINGDRARVHGVRRRDAGASVTKRRAARGPLRRVTQVAAAKDALERSTLMLLPSSKVN